MIRAKLEYYAYQPANTALVRTEQKLLVRVRGYLLPHNFTVKWIGWQQRQTGSIAPRYAPSQAD